MKPDLLRRLEALERTVDQSSRPPLRLVDVMTFDPVDRETYWSGPDGEVAVLTRIGVPLDTPAGSGIHTIIVDLNDASRDQWQATVGMDDADLESYEQAEIRRDQIREREAQEAAEVAKLDAIRNGRDPLPTVPTNAYSPDWD